MAPSLHFLGNEFVITTKKGTIAVNETVRSNTDSVIITKKEAGHTFKLPDCVLAYITDKINLKKVKEYACDVLVLAAHKQHEELLQRLKPRLAVLVRLPAYIKDHLNVARELQKKTGIQTISARDGLKIDLYDYSALAEQKSLSKYTTE